MTVENEYKLGRRAFHRNQEESIAIALAIVAIILLAGGSYILVNRFHLRPSQLVEGCLYVFLASIAGIAVAWHLITLHRRREANWPHPPLFISDAKDRAAVGTASAQNAIISALYFSLIHESSTEVSRPPEYAKTIFMWTTF